MHSLFWPAPDVFCGTCKCCSAILIGALMTIRGAITLGDYMAYIGLVGMIHLADARPGPPDRADVDAGWSRMGA